MQLNIKISFFALLVAGLTAQAQEKRASQLNINYNVGIPSGSFKNSVSSTSLRGLQASVHYGLSQNLAVGAGISFQDFYQKYPRNNYQLSDGSDLSAVRSVSIQTIPVLAQAKWSFRPGGTLQPFATLGVGGALVSYNELAGEFTLEQSSRFSFAARPQVGVFVPFRKNGESGLTLGTSYTYLPFKNGTVSGLSHIGLNAGISIPMRR